MSLIGFAARNHPQQVRRDGANSDVDDRQTPPEIFAPLNAEHQFSIDVAANAHNRLTPRFFGLSENGLERSWSGHRVWCNPPYSDIQPWVEKAWHAMRGELASCVVMLLPSNRTEQKWWQELVEPYRDNGFHWGIRLSVRFLPGRPRFNRPSGKVGGPKGDRPPFGCCVLTWRRA